MRPRLDSIESVLEMASRMERPCICMDPRAGSNRATFHLFAWPDRELVADIGRSLFNLLRDRGHLDRDPQRREEVRYGEMMQAWPVKG